MHALTKKYKTKNYKNNIKDHWSQINKTNIIIIIKFEIFQETPKYYTESYEGSGADIQIFNL